MYSITFYYTVYILDDFTSLVGVWIMALKVLRETGSICDSLTWNHVTAPPAAPLKTKLASWIWGMHRIPVKLGGFRRGEVRGGDRSESFDAETHQLCLYISTAPAGVTEQVHWGIKHRGTKERTKKSQQDLCKEAC